MVATHECLKHIRDTLGGDLSDYNPEAIQILNQAGQYLHTMHEWAWCLRPQVSLDIRGDVEFSNGSAPTGSAVLTVSGATSYTFLEGDQVQLTGGTGVTARFAHIVSQSGTALTLDSTVHADAGTVSNIAGTVIARASRLPSDLRKIISINATEGLVSQFTFTDMTSLNRARASGIVTAPLAYVGALSWGRNRATTGGAPVPRLELYGTFPANISDALKLTYVAGWTNITSDTTSIEIPDFIDILYIQLVRTFARAYAQEDEAQLDLRLEVIHKGRTFRAAKDRDGEMQPTLGMMLGGAAQEYDYYQSAPFSDTAVGDPS